MQSQTILPLLTHSELDTAALTHSQQLLNHIRTAIKAAPNQRLSFDQFMNLALYAPGLGYYVAGAVKLGAAGDFMTAPEISPLFGRCIAHTCVDVFHYLGGNGNILELGAGSGQLAIDILIALDHIGRCPPHYWILEISPDLQARQRALIAARIPHLLPRVQWITALPSEWRGVILANEVMDAMPVQRFYINDDGAAECFVTLDEHDQLIEITAAVQSPGLADAIVQLQVFQLLNTPVYYGEFNPHLKPWLSELAAALQSGLLLLIDYGGTQTELYHPERRSGTLMCHYRHRAHTDPYQLIGLQDITAHVNFTAVADAGEQAGLKLVGYTTQASYLVNCGIEQLLAEANTTGDTATQLQFTAGVKQLLLPTQMGERFKVIGFAQGELSALRDFPQIRGFLGYDLSNRL
ncbi:class I SAM-dependent methyltransferase [Thiospirillum jenense]|uniref:SAM-dependent methyltransferase n=1 Tax=Thiospirillum jenense TaxID=1653858 RepID=A0A839H844_9GAMM|nr:SAM-dependent methyltransferase [Thiospirillum jenense]MBB1125361.1 SAM-dependent methyltransferase [Thiospirillum jenense]